MQDGDGVSCPRNISALDTHPQPLCTATLEKRHCSSAQVFASLFVRMTDTRDTPFGSSVLLVISLASLSVFLFFAFKEDGGLYIHHSTIFRGN